MFALKNRVQLIGQVAGSPERKELGELNKVAVFTLVTTDYYWNSEGDKVSELQWHRIVARGKMASFALQHLNAGQEIAISGKLVNRSFYDKDAKKRTITEIQLTELLRLGDHHESIPIKTARGNKQNYPA